MFRVNWTIVLTLIIIIIFVCSNQNKENLRIQGAQGVAALRGDPQIELSGLSGIIWNIGSSTPTRNRRMSIY